eukprot:386024-Prorocentrum_minimum.AAC.1
MSESDSSHKLKASLHTPNGGIPLDSAWVLARREKFANENMGSDSYGTRTLIPALSIAADPTASVEASSSGPQAAESDDPSKVRR